ncbi:MJ0042-type zinc finger domain-containing protein [Caulobacter segnis]|uniref:MJ0042-type zinc finger domain-containing protein n=1 Tax=Caulobacter segnis TaxID=88688 RepID=UPI00268E7686|nr:MJ0042-type zinc finger domain-containing protein [Caulobacter segnis]
MILTCPECASRYFVDDSKVGPEGRVVRCAACGHRWTARNEEPADPFADAESPTLASQGEPDPAPAAEDDQAETTAVEVAPVSEPPSETATTVAPARAAAQRRRRDAMVTGIVWAGMAALMAALIIGALIFRIDVVRILPGTAGAYAAVGLPVNTVGLVIDRGSIKAQPVMKNGRAAVTVTGAIRNITEHAVVAPALSVELLNAEGKRVSGQLASAHDAKIPPGEVRHFSITFLDPPRTAKDLQVGFATEHGGVKAPIHPEPGHSEPAHGKGAESHGGEPEVALRGAQQTSAASEAAGQAAPGHESGNKTAPTASHEPAHHE